MKDNILDTIKNKIDLGFIFQPILFLWENQELLSHKIHALIDDLFAYYQVDKNYLHTLNITGEKIKIIHVRDFISKSDIKSNFKFQLFLIEDISRMSPEGFHACLKFLEEPWFWNIIFLTNTSESWILDTVLSRVQIIHLFSETKFIYNEFFLTLIDDFIQEKNVNIMKYFFNDKKIDKEDYIHFFHSFLYYIKMNGVYIELLDQIENSLHLIQKNNVLPKYEIDKLLLKL